VTDRPLALVGSAPAPVSPAGASAAPAAIEPLLTAEQVAAILGVRPKRVYELGIPGVRLSVHCVRWRRADLSAWIASRTVA
jgi:predicted DNA-binding transcriptional regulator AlpA